MAVEKRKYDRREYRLIKDWIIKNYSTYPQWRNQRLGAIPGTPAEKVYKGLRR